MLALVARPAPLEAERRFHRLPEHTGVPCSVEGRVQNSRCSRAQEPRGAVRLDRLVSVGRALAIRREKQVTERAARRR